MECEGEDCLFPKYIIPQDYINGPSFVSKQICKLINKLPYNKCPIYCSDDRRNKFFIFTKKGWLKSNDDDEIDKIMSKLVYDSYKIIHKALTNLARFRPFDWYKANYKRVYGMPYDEIAHTMFNKVQLIMMNIVEEREKAAAKLKIELSKITSNKKAKYVEEKETFIDIDLESEYNCEDDPDN